MMDLDRVDRSLALLRGEISPGSSDKERMRARLGLSSKAPAPTGAAFEPPALRRWAALQASGRLGALLGVALLGAGVGIGFWLRGETRTTLATAAMVTPSERQVEPTTFAGPALATAPHLVPADPEPFARAPELSASPSPRVAHKRAAALVVPPPKAVVPTPWDAELGLLRRVERALRTNDPSLALALLGELDTRFPDTRLAEERLAARRIAECRAGSPDATLHARDFLREHASSVYSERVAAACVPENTPNAGSPVTKGASPDTHSR